MPARVSIQYSSRQVWPERSRTTEAVAGGISSAVILGLVKPALLVKITEIGLKLLDFLPKPGPIGAVLGWLLGLSVGGTTLLAVLAGSASYIAAPAAMRIALPEANPSLSLTASLGITFPFNIFIGIPVYYAIAGYLHGIGG